MTSLTINTGAVTLVQVRDIMAQLPNLDDLELLGFAEAESKRLPGIGMALNGRFGGRLVLPGACVSEGVIDMLLEVPSGLRFAELELYCTRDPLPPSAVRLAEACRKTLVKLSYSVNLYCKSYPLPQSETPTLTPFPGPAHHATFERSFDFSKLPNIQEVTFGFTTYWGGEGLPLIPMALSTLRPATSPHISTIRLDFCATYSRPRRTVITALGNDLRRIADEITQIEREFGGAVDFTVAPDSEFQVEFDTLNVRFIFVGWKRPRTHVDSSSFAPCRSFRTTFIEMGLSRLPLLIGHSAASGRSVTHAANWLTGTLTSTHWILHVHVVGIGW